MFLNNSVRSMRIRHICLYLTLLIIFAIFKHYFELHQLQQTAVNYKITQSFNKVIKIISDNRAVFDNQEATYNFNHITNLLNYALDNRIDYQIFHNDKLILGKPYNNTDGHSKELAKELACDSNIKVILNCDSNEFISELNSYKVISTSTTSNLFHQ